MKTYTNEKIKQYLKMRKLLKEQPFICENCFIRTLEFILKIDKDEEEQ